MKIKIDLYLNREVVEVLRQAEKLGTKRKLIIEEAIAAITLEDEADLHTTIMVEPEIALKFRKLKNKNKKLNDQIMRMLKNG